MLTLDKYLQLLVNRGDLTMVQAQAALQPEPPLVIDLAGLRPEDYFVVGERLAWGGQHVAALAGNFSQVMLANESPANIPTLMIADLFLRSGSGLMLVNRLVPFSVAGWSGPLGTYRDLQIGQNAAATATAIGTVRTIQNAVQQGSSSGVMIPATNPPTVCGPVILPSQSDFIFMPDVANQFVTVMAQWREIELRAK